MKLYPKKLRNVKDLEKEKKFLLRQQRELDKEDILSVKGIFGKKGAKDDDDYNDRGSSILGLLDYLPISNPLVSMGIKIAQRWFSKKKGDAADDDCDDNDGKKKGKSPLRTIALEVIGGYLKWKAIELSYKGIRHIIKTRRRRKEQ